MFNDDAVEGLSFYKKKRGSKGERERNLGLESSSWNLFLRGSKRWTKKDIHIRITQQLNYNPSKFFKGCTFKFFLSAFASGSDPLAIFFSSTFILDFLRQTLVRIYFFKKMHIFKHYMARCALPGSNFQFIF